MMTTDPVAPSAAAPKRGKSPQVALAVAALGALALGAAVAFFGSHSQAPAAGQPAGSGGGAAGGPVASGATLGQAPAKADEFWSALPDPLVTVQGQKVMRDEVRAQLPARADQLLADQPGGESLLYAAAQAAERLVDERLAIALLPQDDLQALQTRVNLERDSEVRRHGGLEPWTQELARRLQTPAGWVTLARTRAALDMALEVTDTQPATDDAVLQQRYIKRKSRWQLPPMVRWREIAVAVEPGDSAAGEKARQTLQAALERLARGEDFGALATELSGGHSRSRGGDRGWTRPGEVDAELNRALQALAVGQRSGLVVSSHGMHILEVLEKRPESLRPFEEARDQLRGEFLAELRFSQRRQLLKALRGKAEIRWATSQLAEVTAQAAPGRAIDTALPATPVAHPAEPGQAPGHP